MNDHGEPDGLAVSTALRAGRDRLDGTETETPGLDAEVLLRHVMGVDRATFFTRLPEFLAPAMSVRFQGLIEERARGVPVAYLTGEREFMGLPFAVDPGVLVPRPETELLVEWAIGWLKSRGRPFTVVDIGTGSGAIALSIAARLDDEGAGHIVASDVSRSAIEVAARNRTRLGLDDRVTFVQGSLATWVGQPVGLVLANLPYLRPGQIAENPQLAAEPRLALDGGHDGLGFLRPLLQDAPRIVAVSGAVGLEIDPSQRQAVVDLATSAFPRAEITVLRDLAGRDRHVIVQTVPC